jgi:hypothetical protein
LKPTTSAWARRLTTGRRLLAKKIFRLSGGMNRLFRKQSAFSIKPGYFHAGFTVDFDDTSNTDEWQKEVYLLAASLLKEKGVHSVVDVGCGSGYKLVNYFNGFQTKGIEIKPIYEWLKTKYPDHEWLQFEVTDPSKITADLVICSDVIEHIKNPDMLMDFIAAIPAKIIVISTPERDAVAGTSDYGPPANPSHFREWNAAEFSKYCSQWFIIEDQRIFNGISTTQALVCKKK